MTSISMRSRALLGAVAIAACSSLVDVSDPDVVQPSNLDNASGAKALRAGAIFDFTNAYSAASFGYAVVTQSGTLADEFISADIVRDNDRRVSQDPDRNEYPYNALQKAKIDIDLAIAALEKYSPTPPADIGELFALRGFVEWFFAAHMCNGVPLSALQNGVPMPGVPMSTTEMLNAALANFDSALVWAAAAPADARIGNLARVGRGRTLLLLAQYSAAATAVISVPSDFTYVREHSTAIQPNALYRSTFVSKTWSVADREGTNGLNFRTANDARVPTQLVGKGIDATTDIYGTSKFPSDAAPVTLASGIEGRLISAEAAYQANPDDTSPTGSGWLGILNDLRATRITPALPALADPGTRAARVDLLFRERAFWLFGTGLRLSDLRRLIRQYSRGTETVFPTGVYRAGLNYGTQVTYAPSLDEYNNTNFKGCIDRNP